MEHSYINNVHVSSYSK